MCTHLVVVLEQYHGLLAALLGGLGTKVGPLVMLRFSLHNCRLVHKFLCKRNHSCSGVHALVVVLERYHGVLLALLEGLGSEVGPFGA